MSFDEWTPLQLSIHQNNFESNLFDFFCFMCFLKFSNFCSLSKTLKLIKKAKEELLCI